MSFSNDDILNIAKNLSDFKELKISDIPCVDLYMDQVTTLFEDRLSHLKRKDDEPILTKTMINNYAKAKILTPIKNKKYNKTQIILLILIYNLKQTLSLEDINFLLNSVINGNSDQNQVNLKLNELYDNFLSLKEKHSDTFINSVSEALNSIDIMYSSCSDTDDSTYKLILTVLSLINSANLQKRLAEKIIDEFLKPSKK